MEQTKLVRQKVNVELTARPTPRRVNVDLSAASPVKKVNVELSAICVPKELLSDEILEYLQRDLSQNASFDEQFNTAINRAVYLMRLGLESAQQGQALPDYTPIGSGGSGAGVITEAFTGFSGTESAVLFDREKAIADTQDLATLF